MTIRVHGVSKALLPQSYKVNLTEAELAEAGSESIGLNDGYSAAGQDLASNAEVGAGFTYSDTVEGDSLDDQPGFSAAWAQGQRRTFQVFARVNVAAPASGGPEEAAEDGVDVQLWDLAGNVLAKSEEAEAASGGVDVAEEATEFTLNTGVMSAEGSDGFRLVVTNRPTGDESADGEVADYQILDGDLVIAPGN